MQTQKSVKREEKLMSPPSRNHKKESISVRLNLEDGLLEKFYKVQQKYGVINATDLLRLLISLEHDRLIASGVIKE